MYDVLVVFLVFRVYLCLVMAFSAGLLCLEMMVVDMEGSSLMVVVEI